MKIGFAGTPEFASVILEALSKADGIEIVAVFSQPARPRGRGLKFDLSPVEAAARAMDLPVSTPAQWGADEIRSLRSSNIDILVTAAYGIILPAAVLDIPRLGAINVHASMLPRWRGAAPIQRTIEAGDSVSGITIFKMDEGIDTGPVLATRETRIGPDETATDLTRRLAELAAKTLPEVLRGYVKGDIAPIAQNKNESTYARKLKKCEGELSWRHTAAEIYRKHRAFTPWPGVVIGELKLIEVKPVEHPIIVSLPNDEPQARNQRRVSPGEILSLVPLIIATADGALRLDKVQRSGGRPVTGAEYARGKRLSDGDHLA